LHSTPVAESKTNSVLVRSRLVRRGLLPATSVCKAVTETVLASNVSRIFMPPVMMLEAVLRLVHAIVPHVERFSGFFENPDGSVARHQKARSDIVA